MSRDKIPAMTQKDFEFIAEVIAALPAHFIDKRDVAEAFADSLRFTNGRFDMDRFMCAAASCAEPLT